jgi:hypothetical protein
MADSRNKFHLLPGQPLCACRRHKHDARACPRHCQDAETDHSLGKEGRGFLDRIGADHDGVSVPIDQQGWQNLGKTG